MKTEKTSVENVEKIHNRIFKHRLDQNKDYSDWTFISIKTLKGKTDEKITELLDAGYEVSSGYYTTAVRGFHEYYLMWRKK